MEYFLIIVSVIMFGGCFAFQDVYRRLRGASGIKMTFEMLFIGSAGGLVVLFIANCLSFENGISFDISGLNPGFTWFTLLIAFLAAANSFAFTFCGIKALGSINLSLFSLFSMLGGMVLPFFQGIIFYGEKPTLDKIICVIFILAALLVTLDLKSGNATKKDKFAPVYYVGIFVFNGMSGVLSKIFASSTLPKTSSAGYSIWLALICTVASAVILFTVFRKRAEGELPLSFKLGLLSGSSGALNKIANYILVVALASGIDASIQYPMVTGGVMIVSTACAYLTDNKPKAKELISVALAFIGMLALFIVPMLIN